MTTDVFVEVHDFGFGPACGFLDITEKFAHRYRWHVLAAGNAAAFIEKERPGVDLIPFNGFKREIWHQLSNAVPADAPLITFSNPGFAAYAAQQGYRVHLVDQLDWMWPAYPDGIEQVDLHLVQYYFGKGNGKARASRAIEIRPIVTPTAASSESRRNSVGTVIGLGGMAIAGDPQAGDAYARWLLSQVLAALENTPKAFPITVVGGSPNLAAIANALGDNRVFAAGGVGRRSYMELLRGSRFQILTPGLASIYEAAAIGISPLFQPGVNKSMLLQLDSLIGTGYPFATAWPWFKDVRDTLSTLPPADALDLITRSIASSMRGEDESGERIRAAMEDYISSPEDKPVPIEVPRRLPDGTILLEKALQTFSEKISKKFGT